MNAVIFDLGQVLIPLDHARMLDALAAISQADPATLDVHLRQAAHDLQTGAMDASQFHRRLVELAGMTPDFERFQTAFCANMARDDAALAYAVELQQRPGVTVGVISNTNDAHVRWLDRYVPELDQLDLVMMSNEVGLAKPDPAIFELALELLGVPPAAAIFVDDLAEHVQAAQALGLAGVVHRDWSGTRPAIEAWLRQRRDG